MDEFFGVLSGKDTTGAHVRVALDANNGNVSAGGSGRGGDVLVCDDTGKVGIWLDAGGLEETTGGGLVKIDSDTLSGATLARIRLRASDGQNAGIWVGGQGRSGDLRLLNGAGEFTIALRSVEDDVAGVWIGGGGEDARRNQTGWLIVRNKDRRDIAAVGGEAGQLRLAKLNGDVTITMNAAEGPAGEFTNVYVGGHGNDGGVVAQNTGDIRAAYIGSINQAGQLLLAKSNGDVTIEIHAAEGPSGEFTNLYIGGHGNDGGLLARNTGDQRAAYVGSEQDAGRLVLAKSNGDVTIRASAVDGANKDLATLWVGGNGQDGDILVFSKSSPDHTNKNAAIRINGKSGDIILRNADCAEEFELAPGCEIVPGTVMVIGEGGLLTRSDVPYDRAVAGVVSGAGDDRPGIILGHHPGERRRLAIALTGRVHCRVDADFGPIEVGSLLTTSANPGHAMSATDPCRSFGAVLGKALRPLNSGQATIPILVSLQ